MVSVHLFVFCISKISTMNMYCVCNQENSLIKGSGGGLEVEYTDPVLVRDLTSRKFVKSPFSLPTKLG